MGLDLAELNLPARLRAWYASGLRYIFAPASKCAPEPEGERPAAKTASASEPLFPSPWQEIFAACRPPHPHVWTYWKLCLDLGPEAGQDRSTLFSNILASLQWPRENVVFWPLSRSSPSGIVAEPEPFWKGIKLLCPRYILCFGLDAFQALFPDRRAEYGSFASGRAKVLFLPGPDDMLPDNRQAKGLVWHALQTLRPGS